MRVHFGQFVFDGDRRELRRGDQPIHLTPKAFDLLGALIAARPRALRKEELRETLWPDVVVDEANLKNLVAEIRAALGKAAVRTVHRFGYAFGESAPQRGMVARLVAGDRVYRLSSGENVIGRDDDCAVAIDFTGVSRRHAAVHVSGGGVTLEDLGSKNGTWLNGERLFAPAELHDGDRIRLGAAALTFRSTACATTTSTLNAAGRDSSSGRR